jgi:hypothetical protein
MPDDGRRGLNGFAGEARAWVQGVRGRVPSYARLVDEALAFLDEPAGEPVREALEQAWGPRAFEASYHRPLLLFAAMRAEALADGPTHPLWPAVAAEPPRPETVTRATVAAALAPERLRMYARLATRSVQTNETSRAVAWLWPAHLLGADDGRRPVALIDVGASAGLNLVADRLPAPWTQPDGALLPVVHSPSALLRVGFDRAPLDVRDEDAVAWLEACVWPGEPHRLERLRDAVAAMRAAYASYLPVRLERAEAAAIPALIEAHTRSLPPHTLVLVYQTVFIEYLSPPAAAAYVTGLRRWLARTPAAVWLELELGPQPSMEYPASLTATVRLPGGDLRAFPIARTGYHPSVVMPDPAAVFALQAAVSALDNLA